MPKPLVSLFGGRRKPAQEAEPQEAPQLPLASRIGPWLAGVTKPVYEVTLRPVIWFLGGLILRIPLVGEPLIYILGQWARWMSQDLRPDIIRQGLKALRERREKGGDSE